MMWNVKEPMLVFPREKLKLKIHISKLGDTAKPGDTVFRRRCG